MLDGRRAGMRLSSSDPSENVRTDHYESPALTTELLAQSSGGGTRTLNNTVNSRVLCLIELPRIEAWEG